MQPKRLWQITHAIFHFTETAMSWLRWNSWTTQKNRSTDNKGASTQRQVIEALPFTPWAFPNAGWKAQSSAAPQDRAPLPPPSTEAFTDGSLSCKMTWNRKVPESSSSPCITAVFSFHYDNEAIWRSKKKKNKSFTTQKEVQPCCNRVISLKLLSTPCRAILMGAILPHHYLLKQVYLEKLNLTSMLKKQDEKSNPTLKSCLGRQSLPMTSIPLLTREGQSQRIEKWFCKPVVHN